MTQQTSTPNNHAEFIWSIANLLRGDYKQSEYGKVILPLTVLRRLDCVSEPTKQAVITRKEALARRKIDNIEPILRKVAGHNFYNTHTLTFKTLLDDPQNLASNLRAYIAEFDPEARDIINKFAFNEQITRLDRANLIYKVVASFAEIDLHPNTVSNLEMGYLYEELIRRFSELSNETAGEHFTPREVIRLMVNLLFNQDNDKLATPGIIQTLYDPACGTGGMLSVAEEYLREINPKATLNVFGQELNAETYAVCRSDMILKGQDASSIYFGNTFTDDGHNGQNGSPSSFDYSLANPPFGVEWKKYQAPVKQEHEQLGFNGRFGAGLPRISDGSMLFLQHMISKMKPAQLGGSRIAIVFNGSPLFTGSAGSGESEIRRWIIENDWLEAVVALPDQLFYNTGISTYFWIVTNRKSDQRRGKIHFIDARELYTPMRKSLGNKRKMISDEQIKQITKLYSDFQQNQNSKIFPNEAFGFMRITIERPLRAKWSIDKLQDALKNNAANDKINNTQHQELSALNITKDFDSDAELKKFLKETAPNVKGKALTETVKLATAKSQEFSAVTNSRGRTTADPEIRDYENVSLPQLPTIWLADPDSKLQTQPYRAAVDEYMATEVLPHIPDAWVDHTKTKIGYEIPLTRHFYNTHRQDQCQE